MAKIEITINEDGTLNIKTECEVGEEETSLEEIREMFDGIAEVRDIIRDPPKQLDRFQSYMESDFSGSNVDNSDEDSNANGAVE